MTDETHEPERPPLGQLGLALAKAQGELGKVTKSHTANAGKYSYTYADLASVIEAIREPFAKHELAYFQAPSADGERVTVTTTLIHSSGESLSSALTLVAADDSPQAIGSAITYARRYGLLAAAGLAPEDDDGAAAQPSNEPETRRSMQNRSKRPDDRTISEAQAKRLYAMWKSAGRDDNDVKAYLAATYNINSTREIARADYEAICAWVTASDEQEQAEVDADELTADDISF